MFHFPSLFFFFYILWLAGHPYNILIASTIKPSPPTIYSPSPLFSKTTPNILKSNSNLWHLTWWEKNFDLISKGDRGKKWGYIRASRCGLYEYLGVYIHIYSKGHLFSEYVILGLNYAISLVSPLTYSFPFLFLKDSLLFLLCELARLVSFRAIGMRPKIKQK